MTVMAAEAGSRAAVSGASEATAGSRKAFTGTRAPAARASRPAARQTPGRASDGRRQQRTRRAGKTAARAVGVSGGTDYQHVVLAEFILAVLLISATPFARKNQGGLSPYLGKDLVQLVAVVIVYFLLALMAGTAAGTARLAAWFGGLVLLTVGLAEAAALAQALDVFGIASSKDQAAEATAEAAA